MQRLIEDLFYTAKHILTQVIVAKLQFELHLSKPQGRVV